MAPPVRFVRPVRPGRLFRYLRASFAGVAIGLAAGAASAAGAELPAGPEILELASSPVELVAPLPASVLVAGSTAELAWRPLADAPALAGAEEWEAFLSLDGGRTFAVRLTPHLDLALRRVAFQVPDLPSDSARLLLRFGDERQERAVLLPGPLRIVRDPSPAPRAGNLWRERTFTAGEPARSGEPGVVFWEEGRRDGSGSHSREAAPTPSLAGTAPVALAGEAEALADGINTDSHRVAGASPETHPATAGLRAAAVPAHAEPLPAPDILLLIQRQNE